MILDIYIYRKGNQEIFPNGLSEVKTGTFVTNLLHDNIKYHVILNHYLYR